MGKRDKPGYSAEYHRKNSKHLNECKRLRRVDAPWIHLRQAAKRRAKSGNLPFDLGLEEVKKIVEPMTCECCGRKLRVSKGVHKEDSPSIDRFDPRKGYTMENISLLCYRCNYLKADASLAELHALIKWMFDRAANVPDC